ncbi:DUF642 domain-containing protein [Streptomyces venezuelae]|uniref:DUF642 domain-containing protein n=1 Tax=Streptomyces venezuelae TaxID=54571 RepID=UPI0037A31950
MNKHMRALVLATSALTALTLSAPAPSAAGSNKVENGRFDEPKAPAGPEGRTPVAPGQENNQGLKNWKVTKGVIEVFGSELSRHPRSYQSMNLTGTEVGGIRQEVDLEDGTHYILTWEHHRETWPDCKNAQDQDYSVFAEGTDMEEPAEREPHGERWAKQTKKFVAQDDNVAIEFLSESEIGHCGAMITDVRLKEDPNADEGDNGGGEEGGGGDDSA